MTRCSVPKCSQIGTHKFPSDEKIRKLWLKAIRRQKFTPSNSSRLCRNHFLESDYLGCSRDTGLEHQHRHLKKNAVPSLFPWNNKPLSEQAKQRQERLSERNRRKSLFQDIPSTSHSGQDFLPLTEQEEADVSHEVEVAGSEQTIRCSPDLTQTTVNNKTTQTSTVLALFSTDNLITDHESVNFYTGLENYAKFKLVLSTLLPMAYNIKYRWSKDFSLSVEDQFLMLLMKLRRNKTDFELCRMFGVSKTTVSNIIVTWINFVSDIWRLIDIWPSRKLVNFYMPDIFYKSFPATRVIVDGTEIPIQKPSQPQAQKATFSTYKHKNTMKILVGSSPGGLLSYCSEAYAGSTSDRQIVERSELLSMCEEGDSIMADRGFNVQDLFANKGVGINIPTFLKGKAQIPGILAIRDQKLASQRVHIERLIGLTKTYTILKTELNQFYVPLASKIFFICFMLCNFREGIVTKNKR